MLTFLRKIRKSFLESGSARKPASPAGRYLVYAIGEILLVMVGILLALQVNNWNERRKSRDIESTLLTELHKSVEDDIESIKLVIKRNQSYTSSEKIVLDHMDKNRLFNDSVSAHLQRSFRVWRIYIKTSAYDNLKEYGLHIIENPESRNSIISAYGGRSKFVDELFARYDQFRYNVVEHELSERYMFKEIDENDYGLFPINNDLKSDHHRLRYLLIKSIDLRDQIIRAMQRTLNSFEDLEEGLMNEINTLKL